MTLKLLLVEVQDSYRSIAVARFSAAGFEVSQTNCGSAALKKNRYADFDVVVVDEKLPDMSGQQLAQRLNEQDKRVKLLVVVNPSSADSEEPSPEDRMVEDWLMLCTGPLHPDQLLKKVERLVSDGDTGGAHDKGQSRGPGPSPSENREINSAHLDEVRSSYKQKLPDELLSLRKRLDEARKNPTANRPWDEIFGMTHNIHGTAGTLGFPEISEAARKIGEMTKIIRFEEGEADEEWRKVFDMLDRAVEHLKD